jgi:DNA-binding NarL/FixJ family response regulator
VSQLGLRDFLDNEDIEVVAELQTSENVFERVAEVRPDVVILNLERDVLQVAADIASHFPATKVVVCSSEEPVMRIFPRFHRGKSYSCPLSNERLAEALKRDL